MGTFTKGPWVVAKSADNGIHCVDAIDPVDGKNFEVCEVWGINHDKTEDDVSRANAQLICAAPDLLEALEMIVSEADSYTARTGKPVYNWLDQARAAIARAKGEE